MYITTIITPDSRSVDVELRCEKQLLRFCADNMWSNSFEELVQALLSLAEQKHTHRIIAFNLESEGVLYMLISSYPNALTRISCYLNINWDSYEEAFEDQPLPRPVFDVLIGSPYYFIRNIVKQLQQQGKEAYSSWDNDFFDTTLPVIEQLIYLKI